jgi:hypothetical protein
MSTIPVVKNDAPTQLGGRKKKGNGHKANCGCPICKNMKHAKGTKRNKRNKRGGSKRRRRGGRNEPEEIDEEEFEEEFEDEAGEEGGPEDEDEDEPKEDIEEDSDEEDEENEMNEDNAKEGGRKKKKKNGHKANCKCPICINMKHANKSKYTKNKKNKRGGTKRRRRGGGEDDEESAEASANADVSGSDASASARDAPVARAPSNPNSTTPNGDSSENVDTTGGRRRKKSNGHKANCKCPICKNMKKSKRGGEDGDIENQKGDIEEGFVKGEKIVDIETKAGDDDYEEIEQIQKMEEGEGPGPYNPQAYENVGGKRRRGKTRKSRKHKSRRHRKRTRRHRRKM